MATPVADRVILIVLDGCGCGHAPDAAEYGDVGANTLAHIAAAYPELDLPNLACWGLGHIADLPQVPAFPVSQIEASFGRCRERSAGKDTTSGHWELAGVVMDRALATFPHGFPAAAIDRWVTSTGIPGVLGNVAASGTEIIRQLGAEHCATGCPILYTSADSVWQVAAHEETFGLQRLYDICQVARGIADDLGIGRVIARPFLGNAADGFQRTANRHDYSLPPPGPTVLDYLQQAGLPTLGIGKIADIFAGRGITASRPTGGNDVGMATLLAAVDDWPRGLIFANLVDFDMLYGHRRDVPGFAAALQHFDHFLPRLEARLDVRDLVIISADHGIDPTYRGTDHTRELVPLLAYQRGRSGRNLGLRDTFADVGQTVFHALTGQPYRLPFGQSFLDLMGSV